MYQAKTLRRLPPTARKLARMANTLELEVRRLRALVPIVKVHEDVHNFARRPKDDPQAELPASLEARVLRGSPWMPSD